MKFHLLFLIAALSVPFTGKAAGNELTLGTPFSDNAILQREMTVPVWGWSKPGTEVTVEFAGQKKQATANKSGKWMLQLEPLKASAEPAEMKISENGGASLSLKNLLVGEVWVASGQSNMQWIVSKSRAIQLVKAIEASGVKPPIRECKVTDVYAALHPIERATGEWSDGQDFNSYSAIAFSFAHKLYEELNVPIGILNCSFSQTSIEAWTPREGFAEGKDPYIKSIYQKILETDPTTAEHKSAWEAYYQALEKSAKEEGRFPEDKPGNLNGNRDASWLFNARLNPMIPYAIRGIIWNQGYANMNGGMKYYANLHSMIGGWRKLWDRPELPVYFHQFYTPGRKDRSAGSLPATGGVADMRLGTWMARDIPHTGMASQIDIEGSIHYTNKVVPGRRLALHALKNQYGKDVVADGPMFQSYSVDGDKLIVEFEHAEGGLVVAETGSNALTKDKTATGFAEPKIIPNGDDQMKLFYLAGEDRVWHPASAKIEGNKVIVSSPQVKTPLGISYGASGIGFQPNLYNQALLPATPFIYFDKQLVTAETWSDGPLKIHGEKIDPNAGGLLEQYYRLPLLSTQFRDDAVLQSGVPVTIWGSTALEWADEVEGDIVVKFSFNGIEKSLPIAPGTKEWSVTVPAMAASAEPKTLKVRFEVGGELAHERVAQNIVIGDVWYVAVQGSGLKFDQVEKSDGIVRMMTRKAKRSSSSSPSRFSIATSTSQKNRFASLWEDADGAAAAIGHRIGKLTGKPVGIIFMESPDGKKAAPVGLKSWIPAEALNAAPSLLEDYKELAGMRPGNEYYTENVMKHIADWKQMWNEYIPEMIATKRVPDGVAWGAYPALGSSVETKASETHNIMVESFTPAALKGVIFLSGPGFVADDQGALFGEQFTALANGLRKRFGGDPTLLYTVPAKSLAPKITQPKGIEGTSKAIEINDWKNLQPVLEEIENVVK